MTSAGRVMVTGASVAGWMVPLTPPSHRLRELCRAAGPDLGGGWLGGGCGSRLDSRRDHGRVDVACTGPGEGDGEQPLHDEEELPLQSPQVEDVDDSPAELSEQPGQLDAASLHDGVGDSDRGHVALVEVLEWTGR